MKTKIALLLIASSLFAACMQGPKKKDNAQVQSEVSVNPNLKLKIYYFHLSNRCVTCNSIETHLKDVLETNYSEELKQGTIQFEVLNVEQAANKALAKKYQASGSALHLVYVAGGAENDHDLTFFAFSYARNSPDVFKKGIKDRIDKMLSL